VLALELVDAVLLLLEPALLLLGVGGGLLLLTLEAALGLGQLGGGVGALAGGLAEGLLGGGHGSLEGLHVGLAVGGGVFGVGEGLLGLFGLAARERLTGGCGDGLLLERLGELAHALGEDRRVGLLGRLELGLGLGELLLELLEFGERGGAIDLAAAEGVEHLEHGLGDLRGGVLAVLERAQVLAQRLGEGAVGARAGGGRSGGVGAGGRAGDRDLEGRGGRHEHGREHGQGAGPAEQQGAGAGARQRDHRARVDARSGSLGVGGQQGDHVGAARVIAGFVRRELECAAEQVVQAVVVVEAAGGGPGRARAKCRPQQRERHGHEAEPGQVGEWGRLVAPAVHDRETEGGEQQARGQRDLGQQAGRLGEALAPLYGAHEPVYGVEAGHRGSWSAGHVPAYRSGAVVSLMGHGPADRSCRGAPVGRDAGGTWREGHVRMVSWPCPWRPRVCRRLRVCRRR